MALTKSLVVASVVSSKGPSGDMLTVNFALKPSGAITANAQLPVVHTHLIKSATAQEVADYDWDSTYAKTFTMTIAKDAATTTSSAPAASPSIATPATAAS